MRILTVRQPWAYAIIHRGKEVENSVRNIAGDYRGPVAIHAALTGDTFDWRFYDLWPFDERHKFGVIIGVVDLLGAHVAGTCWDCGKSAWAAKEGWHLMLDNPRPLPEPIPYRGAPGLRTLPDDVVAEIETQLGKAEAMSKSNIYIKLEKAPELRHPGYPICGACEKEVELEDEWVCPSCGTSWPSNNMEDDGSHASLFEDWAGKILTGPVCPNEFAWRVSDLPPNERDARIKQEVTRRAERG